MPADIDNWFIEGFDTADLKEGRRCSRNCHDRAYDHYISTCWQKVRL